MLRRRGQCSLSDVGHTIAVIRRQRKAGFRRPYGKGTGIHISEADYIVEGDNSPLPEIPKPASELCAMPYPVFLRGGLLLRLNARGSKSSDIWKGSSTHVI